MPSHLALKIPEKQELLELGTKDRLNAWKKFTALWKARSSVLEVEKRIRGRVKRQMEQTQREYYLNEQMKAIQRELGETEDEQRRNGRAMKRKLLRSRMPKEARGKSWLRAEEAPKAMSPMSAEATVVRNYLDWMTDVPWKKRSRVKQGPDRLLKTS